MYVRLKVMNLNWNPKIVKTFRVELGLVVQSWVDPLVTQTLTMVLISHQERSGT